MSYEAWGTPNSPEPQNCPLCEQTEHVTGCEIAALEAKHRQRIEQAVAREREACAKTVEAEAQRNVTKFGPEYEAAAKAESWAMLQAAHAIRQRSNA